MAPKIKLNMHRLYSFIIKPIRTSKTICFLLFSIWYKTKKYGGYWDWVTVLLRNVIREYTKNNICFLDVGTGPYGILSRYVKKNYQDISITAIDYCKELIHYAKKISPQGNIEFIVSDLFENVKNKYDVIVFNAPYIDLEFGEKIGVLNNELSIKRWSGGKDGNQTIKRFIRELPGHINNDGVCILGVNHYYIKNDMIMNIISESEMKIIDQKVSKLTKAHIYVLSKKNVYKM